MNPYLEHESVWHDFHERFITAVADALVPQVRPEYIVQIDEHAYIHELPSDERRYAGRPDVTLATGRPAAVKPAAGTIEAPAHAILPIAIDEERLAFVEIRDRLSRDLVTVIEVLSPSNKRRGPDREQYLRKRLEFARGPAHFVELDLLRGGPRLPLDELPPCDYYAMVSRAQERPRVGLWAVRLRDALPEIPIPLRPPRADAKLELQGLLHRVFDAGGYEDYIYAQTPQPPLAPEDALWAKQFVP
jgi:hypothetical protein